MNERPIKRMTQQEIDALRVYMQGKYDIYRASLPWWQRLDWPCIAAWGFGIALSVGLWGWIIAYAVSVMIP